MLSLLVYLVIQTKKARKTQKWTKTNNFQAQKVPI